MAHGVCASYTRTPAYYTYFRRRCSRLTLREWGQTQCVSAAHHVGRRQQPDTSHPTPAHAYHDDESRTHTHSLAHATLTRHNDTLTAHGRSTSPTRHSYGFSSGSRQVLPVVAPPFPPSPAKPPWPGQVLHLPIMYLMFRRGATVRYNTRPPSALTRRPERECPVMPSSNACSDHQPQKPPQGPSAPLVLTSPLPS